MKKKYLLFPLLTACLLLIERSVNAQSADSVVARATYEFRHIKDKLQPAVVHSEQMALLLGRNSSMYFSAEKANNDEEQIKQLKVLVEKQDPAVGGSYKPYDLTREVIYQLPSEKLLVTKRKLINYHYVQEELPILNWKITAEKTVISGLKCQQALTHFKGRDYIAWFCADLPFQSGPWKLNGLPGLIVEAHDTKDEVIFKFQGFEKSTRTVPDPEEDYSAWRMLPLMIDTWGLNKSNPLNYVTISIPRDGAKTDLKGYGRLKKAMEDDYESFSAASVGGSGGSLSMPAIRVMDRTEEPKVIKTMENPIELPEIK